jgi:hypothetical protein
VKRRSKALPWLKFAIFNKKNYKIGEIKAKFNQRLTFIFTMSVSVSQLERIEQIPAVFCCEIKISTDYGPVEFQLTKTRYYNFKKSYKASFARCLEGENKKQTSLKCFFLSQSTHA